MKESSKYLLLKAVTENWSGIGPGDWETITWFIFSDGSYKTETSFIPTYIDYNNRDFRVKRRRYGHIKEKEFIQVINILNGKWIDPALNSMFVDGQAWQIKEFYPSGRTKKSSGKIRHLYGQPIERITEILWSKSK